MKLRNLNGDGFVDLLLGPDAEHPPYHFATALNNGNGTFAPGVITQVFSCGEEQSMPSISITTATSMWS